MHCTKNSLGSLNVHGVLNGKQTTFWIILLPHEAFSLWWSDPRVCSGIISQREADSSFTPFPSSLYTPPTVLFLQDRYLARPNKVISFKAKCLHSVKTSKGSLPIFVGTTTSLDVCLCPPKATLTYFSISRKDAFFVTNKSTTFAPHLPKN